MSTKRRRSHKTHTVRSIAPNARQPILTQRRLLKMAQSTHAYVRGNTVKFYEWLDSASASALVPEGPPIWICGDCHIGNLGPVASAEGQVEIQIRDLDQTVIGNPAHDIIRLSLSLAMASRSSDLPGVTTALMIEQVINGYRQALLQRDAKVEEKDVAPVHLVMKQALNRRWRNLAEERIENVRPHIPLGSRFWTLSDSERREIDRLFVQDDVHDLITCLRSRKHKDGVKVLDAAYWMKGCSSLGRLRFAVLAGVGKNHTNGLCIVDIKEAIKAAAPRSKTATMPRNNAQRIVAGAKALSPFLGDRMLAADFQTDNETHTVVLRELMPQDLKFEMERLTQAEAIAAANLFAGVVGKAHARQMDQATREAWAAKLNPATAIKTSRSKPGRKKLNAPSWLWSSVVELVASHEAAYLQHCRQYALDSAAKKTRVSA
jgi:uncharacterized protein (DUF2252 family)